MKNEKHKVRKQVKVVGTVPLGRGRIVVVYRRRGSGFDLMCEEMKDEEWPLYRKKRMDGLNRVKITSILASLSYPNFEMKMPSQLCTMPHYYFSNMIYID